MQNVFNETIFVLFFCDYAFTWKYPIYTKVHSVSNELSEMGKVQEMLKGNNSQLLLQQIVTLGDLRDFREELLIGIKRLLDANNAKPVKKWLKSYEVEKLLEISSNTLMTWRNNGILPYSPLGGIYYYDPDDIEKLLQSRKQRK